MSNLSHLLAEPSSGARIALTVAALLCASQPVRGNDAAVRPNRGAYTAPQQSPPTARYPHAAAPMADSQVRQANSLQTPQVLSDFTRPQQAGPPPNTVQPAPSQAAPPRTFTPPASGKLRPASQPRTTPLPARGASSNGGKPSATAPLLTTGASLAAVLLLFFGVVWVMRRGMPTAQILLPTEVVETLGRAPLPGRQQMQLIRCGNKLLLVCISAAGAETLTEITDPTEIERLSGLCREAHPNSATTAFRQVLEQFGRQRAAPGFVGDSAAEAMHLTGRLPARRLGRQEVDDV